MPRKWPWAVGVAVCAAAAAVVWGWHWQQQRVHADAHPAPAIAAPATPAEISLPGRIQATSVVSVAAPIDGTISQYLVNPGDEVFTGEVLAYIKSASADSAQDAAQREAESVHTEITNLEAELISSRLDASRARSELSRAKAEFDLAEKAYQRQQLLLQAGATPRLTFEKAEHEYRTAKSDYDAREGLARDAEDRVTRLSKQIDDDKAMAAARDKELDNAKAQAAAGVVRSPDNGVVVSRHGQPGDPVNPGMKDLIEIAVNLTALEAVVDTDVGTAQRIRQGQPALIDVAESPGAITGTVRAVNGGRVLVDFVSPTPAVKPGLTAQVKFKLS